MPSPEKISPVTKSETISPSKVERTKSDVSPSEKSTPISPSQSESAKEDVSPSKKPYPVPPSALERAEEKATSPLKKPFQISLSTSEHAEGLDSSQFKIPHPVSPSKSASEQGDDPALIKKPFPVSPRRFARAGDGETSGPPKLRVIVQKSSTTEGDVEGSPSGNSSGDNPPIAPAIGASAVPISRGSREGTGSESRPPQEYYVELQPPPLEVKFEIPEGLGARMFQTRGSPSVTERHSDAVEPLVESEEVATTDAVEPLVESEEVSTTDAGATGRSPRSIPVMIQPIRPSGSTDAGATGVSPYGVPYDAAGSSGATDAGATGRSAHCLPEQSTVVGSSYWSVGVNPRSAPRSIGVYNPCPTASSLTDPPRLNYARLVIPAGRNTRKIKVDGLEGAAVLFHSRITANDFQFSILVDISRYDKKNITVLLVDDIIEVYARQRNLNLFGEELHLIHQMYPVPVDADITRLTAGVTNGNCLFIQAPMNRRRLSFPSKSDDPPMP